MAIFTQIGGISTSSITNVLSGPLGSLFKKKTGMSSYQYPDDLANDPSRMHFIEFTISNITPVTLSNGSAILNYLKSPNAMVTEGASFQQEMEKSKKFSATKVCLYMPDTLNISYDNFYDDIATPMGFKMLAKGTELVKGAIDAAIGSGEGRFNGLKSMATTDPFLVDYAFRGISDKLGLDKDTGDIMLKAQGFAFNPQIQMLYRGNGFRKFQLDFIMTAKSQSESDQISAICNTFVYASSPTLSTGSGMYFTPPSIFNIKMMMAKNTDLSGFSAMLKKAGNSLIPGVNLGSIGGGTSADENTRLFKVGDCVLENVTVDYAPGGWSAHPGGAPIQTRLTMNFSEIHIVNRGRLTSGAVR